MLDETGIDRAVVVQSSNSLAETRRLLDDPGPRIAGVVGWIDLTGDAGAQLDELGPAPRRRLVGIRHLVHLDPDPAWLSRPDVGAALDDLGARDLGFDLVLRSWQLPLAATVAAAHPGVRFVVDHLGGIADTTDDAGWESGLRALAAYPNVLRQDLRPGRARGATRPGCAGWSAWRSRRSARSGSCTAPTGRWRVWAPARSPGARRWTS